MAIRASSQSKDGYGRLSFLFHQAQYHFLKSKIKGDVLDVACGEGDGSLLLAATATSCLGIDLDRQAIDLAQQKKSVETSNVQFKVRDGQSLKEEPGNYDSVICIQALQFIADLDRFFQGVSASLNPEGCFWSATMNRPFYQEAGQFTSQPAWHEFDRNDYVESLQPHFQIKEFYALSYSPKLLRIRDTLRHNDRAVDRWVKFFVRFDILNLRKLYRKILGRSLNQDLKKRSKTEDNIMIDDFQILACDPKTGTPLLQDESFDPQAVAAWIAGCQSKSG